MMDEETRTCWILGIFVMLILLAIVILCVVFSNDGRPSPSEFCVRNGYVDARMYNVDSGVCLKPNDSGFRYPSNQYFGWDGSNWRFAE